MESKIGRDGDGGAGSGSCTGDTGDAGGGSLGDGSSSGISGLESGRVLRVLPREDWFLFDLDLRGDLSPLVRLLRLDRCEDRFFVRV